jgi:hypothetical protein
MIIMRWRLLGSSIARMYHSERWNRNQQFKRGGYIIINGWKEGDERTHCSFQVS